MRLGGDQPRGGGSALAGLGFPDIPPDERAYTRDDVRALRIAAEGIESLRGDHRRAALDAIVREARMVSSHMTRIAEIEIESMAEVGALGLRERVLAEAWQRGLEHSDVGWVLLYAFRRRLEEGLRRRTTLEAGDHPTLAVGFVDLVDFTRTSGSMQTDELGRLLGRFEGLASDIITEAGGRVVKLIGDEAMLVFPTAEEAARGAIELVDACAAGDLPSARAGLSLGPVLARGGDYFGRAVNLASRLVDVALPTPSSPMTASPRRSPTTRRWPSSHTDTSGSRASVACTPRACAPPARTERPTIGPAVLDGRGQP